MMVPTPFKAEHLDAIAAQPGQAWVQGILTPEMGRALEGPYAFTLMSGSEPIVCGAAVALVQGQRAFLWSLLSEVIGPRDFREVHGWAKAFLQGLPFNRMEAAVEVDFEPGHRWMRTLGFVCEAPRAKAFLGRGHDCALYALVREG